MSREANSRELSLHELLSRKTIPVLRDIARNLKLKGYSGEHKNVLLERIQEALLPAERFPESSVHHRQFCLEMHF